MYYTIKVDQEEVRACESLKITSFNDILANSKYVRLIADYPYLIILFNKSQERDEAFKRFAVYDTAMKGKITK